MQSFSTLTQLIRDATDAYKPEGGARMPSSNIAGENIAKTTIRPVRESHEFIISNSFVNALYVSVTREIQATVRKERK